MLVNMPINLFTLSAIIIAFLYLATHIGAKEHAEWFGSKEMFVAFAVVVILFCIGCDPMGVWHMLARSH